MANEYELVSAKDSFGRSYDFQVYPLGWEFVERPGLYIFCAPVAERNWNALYVGQTHDLQSRVGSGLTSHHQYLPALSAGATHIAVTLFTGREEDRLAAETSLITALDPPLNRTGHSRNVLRGF